MKVSIFEPKGAKWSGNAKEVILPVEDGDVCVLDFHQPFLMRLRQGYIRMPAPLETGSLTGPGRRKAVKDGIAFMQGNELTVFMES